MPSKGSRILLGAQNACAELEGAHTGEISLRMLRDAGVTVVILGHSERRHVYGETDALVNKKVRSSPSRRGSRSSSASGRPWTRDRRASRRRSWRRQTRAGPGAVSRSGTSRRVTIAYEPVWAIGTGKNATPQDADAVHRYVRGCHRQLYGAAAAAGMTIQYGGSVKPENIRDLMAMENIDGALVGGASLKAETFLPIVQFDR